MIDSTCQIVTGRGQGKKRGFAQSHLGGTPELTTGRAKPLLFLENEMSGIDDRFFGYVRKTTACWEWIGAKNQYGYGRFWIDGHLVGAHRFSYERFVGFIPSGAYACHSCGNPGCVNPDHIFLGTQRDNMKDASAKDRLGKLTEDQVEQIRKSRRPAKEDAKIFSISHRHVYYIRSGQSRSSGGLVLKTWKPKEAI